MSIPAELCPSGLRDVCTRIMIFLQAESKTELKMSFVSPGNVGCFLSGL